MLLLWPLTTSVFHSLISHLRYNGRKGEGLKEGRQEGRQARRRGKANTASRPTDRLTDSELCPTVNERTKKEEKCVGILQLVRAIDRRIELARSFQL